MENNQTKLNQTQNADPAAGQGAENLPGGNGKLFTQEEVNNVVQARLSRYKAQADKESQEAYSQRLQELERREMKLLVREELSKREMPRELEEVLSCTDEADLKRKLDILQNFQKKAKENAPLLGFRIGAPSDEGCGFTSVRPDPIRAAMGLNRKE